MLKWHTSTIASVTDGLSNTIGLVEDAGRPPNLVGYYPALSGAIPSETCNGKSCPNRWADPDTGNGVSGPNYATSYSMTQQSQLINNFSPPIGGPPACPWSTNNCGPNDESFGFHSGGVNVLIGDGSAHFLSENVANTVFARLLKARDGYPVGKW